MEPGKLRFGILGPLQATALGRPVDLRSARGRVLLAALLLRPNRVVSKDELIELLWGENPPDGAVTTLRSHVMRLRRSLGPAGERIGSAAPGYRITLDEEVELDSTAFLCHYKIGRRAAQVGDWAAAAAAASAALSLWRGTPLEDVLSDALRHSETPALESAHIEVVELLAHALLEQGQSGEATTVLRAAAAEHPHRERTHSLLMSALAADGQRAEALEVYARLRTTLVRDLGIEPSTEIGEAQQRILASETSLSDQPGPNRPIRHSALNALPRDSDDFTGRHEAVAQIEEFFHEDDLVEGVTRVVVIDGMGGVGKSALAVHVAHRLRRRFADGQLFAELRGTSPQPTNPSDVLGSFLHQLGVAPSQVPGPEDERAALFRSLLADRRVLILLDDVRDTAQVAPLLPATSGCAVLMTVRHKLLGLPGCRLLSLDALPRDESRALLARMIGRERVAAEPAATAELLAACIDLPLAVRGVGGRLASRPNWRIEDLIARFRQARLTLSELRFGEQSVRASFEIGFTGLLDTADGARAFCLLGLWAGSSLGLHAAAALLGQSVDRAERQLEHLVDVHMVQSPLPGRYSLHDLLREFAFEKAAEHVTPEDRGAAVARIAQWYTHSMYTVDKALRPTTAQDLRLAPSMDIEVFDPADAAAAAEWGRLEYTNLLEAVRLCVEYHRLEESWRLASTACSPFLFLRQFQSCAEIQETALSATIELGDKAAEASVRNNLAAALSSLNRPEEASVHLESSVQVRLALGDYEGTVRSLNHLGISAAQAGHSDRALSYFQQALDLDVPPVAKAQTYANLGFLHLMVGNPDASVAAGWEAARIYRTQPDPDLGFAQVLDCLADAHRALGDLPGAMRYAREGNGLHRRFTDLHSLANGLRRLASLLTEAGDAEAAEPLSEEADDLERQLAES